jgi:hypothetical protein
MVSQQVDYKTSRPGKIFYMGLSFLIQGDKKNSMYVLAGIALSRVQTRKYKKAGDGSYSISCLN